MKHNIILAGIFGLDLTNAQVAVFIAETTKDIEDLNTFIDYCRDHKEGIEFASKTEKLDILAGKYKKLQEQAKLPHATANQFSKNLAHKVSQANTYIKNLIEQGEQRPFSRLQVDGHPFFGDKEIKALSELGTSNLILELSDTHTLEESIIQLFLRKYIKKASYESLTDGQKRIKKLLSV